MELIISEDTSLANRAETLGLSLPKGLAFFPENFDKVDNVKDFLYRPTRATVRTLFRLNGIALDDLLVEEAQNREIITKSAEWIGPTLFVASAVLSDNGTFLNIAVGIISNYITDFFRGTGKTPSVKLDLIVELTPERNYKRVKFEGPANEMHKLIEKVMELKND